MAKKAYLDEIGHLLDEKGDLIYGIGRYFGSPEEAQAYIDEQAKLARTEKEKIAWNLKVQGYFLEKVS